MAESRPQLYKIRRLVKNHNGEDEDSHYEWFRGVAPLDLHPETYPDKNNWIRLEIDGYPFIYHKNAVKLCERLKVLNKERYVIFHTVVPA